MKEEAVAPLVLDHYFSEVTKLSAS